MELPDLRSGKTLVLGALAVRYIVNRGLAAYVPARAAGAHLEAGHLHLVPDAPVFNYPTWLVWRDDMEESVETCARAALSDVVTATLSFQEEIIDDLAESSGEIPRRFGKTHESYSS